MHQLYSYIYLLPRPQQSNKPSHDTQALTSDCSSLGVTGTHDGQSTRACLKGRQLLAALTKVQARKLEWALRWPSEEASPCCVSGLLYSRKCTGDVDLVVGNKHPERLIVGSH